MKGTSTTPKEESFKQMDTVDFSNNLFGLLGAVRSTFNHWTLETNLTFIDLSPLCLAIGIEFLNAGYIEGLNDFPVRRTKYGYRVGSAVVLDLISCEINTLKTDISPKIDIVPAIILAGLPGSGKSTIVNHLEKRLRIFTGNTKTDRRRRLVDVDFERGRFQHVSPDSVLEMRRSPAFAIPVRFRGKSYFFSADSLLNRFDANSDLMVIIDSHHARVLWRKRLMPDIKIIWLDASQNELARRQNERGRLESVSSSYVDACLRTRGIADLVIHTDDSDTAATVAEILDWLGLEF